MKSENPKFIKTNSDNIIKEANISGGMKKIYISKKSNFKNIK